MGHANKTERIAEVARGSGSIAAALPDLVLPSPAPVETIAASKAGIPLFTPRPRTQLVESSVGQCGDVEQRNAGPAI
eukprot:755029-Hanusia_phi.AAC.22